MSTKLYVGNLSWSTTQDDLAQLFGKYGAVSDTFIATERETGRSRGFGFVTLDSEAANAAAGELNNTEFMGRTIRVNEAQPPGERSGGGGGFGGPRRGGYGGGGGYGGNGGGYGGGGYGGGGYGGGGYGGGGYGDYQQGPPGGYQQGGYGGYGGGRGGGGYGGGY